MYKCTNCGNLFEDGEQDVYREDYGELVSACPCCHGVYEKAHRCKCCDEWFLEDELTEGYCDECLLDELEHSAIDYVTESDLMQDFAEWLSDKEVTR